MIELVEANWPWFLVVLLLGIAIAWFIFVGSRRTRVTREEGADEESPATRNQALIDAPPVAAAPPATAGIAGAGIVTEAAAQDAVAAKPVAASTGELKAVTENAASGDDLTRIKGVGPKLAATLEALGVTGFDQIAGWSEADIDRIDAQLGRFEGRIRRDDWVTQAKLLASGDTQGYEQAFGKL